MAFLTTKYGKTKKYDEPLYINPQSTEELFPVKAIDESGIFVLNNGKYSKLFKLSDINFAGVTDIEQKTIIINFSKVLNSINCRFSYTVADEYEELEDITDQIKAIGGVKSFEVKACFDKQREGLNSTFMFGAQEFKRMANFSAPCQAMYMPFKTQELNDENGTYYGINKLSQNPIIANRKLLDSYHGMILGRTRSGKSVFAKCEIISNRCLHPEDQILIIDPQNEYRGIAHAPGVNGAVVSFDTQKEVYVNPMDVNFADVDYATLQEIIAEKTDFILTLLSSCMRRTIDSEEMGVLNKVIEQVYSENYAMRKKINGESEMVTEFSVPAYMKQPETVLPMASNLTAEEQERKYSPILQDVYQKLKDMDNDVIAQKLAAHMQIFVNGSLNLFNHRTNIDLNRKFIVFDLSGIKDNLRVTCMLVMLEIIRSKIVQNFKQNNWTNVYIDEFHELKIVNWYMNNLEELGNLGSQEIKDAATDSSKSVTFDMLASFDVTPSDAQQDAIDNKQDVDLTISSPDIEDGALYLVIHESDLREGTFDVALTQAYGSEIDIKVPDLSPVTLTKIIVTDAEGISSSSTQQSTEELPQEVEESNKNNSGFRIIMYFLIVVAIGGAVVLLVLAKRRKGGSSRK